MTTLIEVGAHWGEDTERFLKEYPEATIYVFEPVPDLLPVLHEKFAHKILVMAMAVDIENSFKKLNLTRSGDWGACSLYEFVENIHETWESPAFYNVSSTLVPTIRLDTFMDVYGIEEIDYLHVDAQGNDFNVLKSLGDKINKVKAGQVEATKNIQLYQGTDNKWKDIVKWLEERNFSVEEHNNDSAGNEVNITFKRK